MTRCHFHLSFKHRYSVTSTLAKGETYTSVDPIYSLRNTHQTIKGSLGRSLGRLICRFLRRSLRRWGCGMKKHPRTGSRRRGFFPRAWVMAIRLKNNFFPRRWSRREGEFLCTGIIAKRFKDKFFREKDCRQGGGFPRAWALGKTWKNIFVREEGPDEVGFFQAHGFWQKN